VGDLGLLERCHVLAGVGPISSLRALSHLQGGVPGVRIPPEVDQRLRGVPEDQVAAEGARLAAETIERLMTVPGLSGVHVMAIGHEGAIPGILRQAGLAASRPPGTGDAADGLARAR
jgi:methylenetetrahydrofolate reductase (NADPH)